MALFDDVFSGIGGVSSILIDTFGVDVSFVQRDYSTEYNPLSGTTPETTITTKTIKATPFSNFKQNEINETTVKTGDLKTIIKGSDITTDITLHKDYISKNSVDYVIVAYDPINTGDENAVYKLQLRKNV